jgi:hypothetical protein
LKGIFNHCSSTFQPLNVSNGPAWTDFFSCFDLGMHQDGKKSHCADLNAKYLKLSKMNSDSDFAHFFDDE